jgi:hypothetical protein
MSNREKILALAVVCLVGLWGAKVLYGRYQRGQDNRQTQLQAAHDELATLKLAMMEGERAVRHLEGWQERSLPADREKALTLYKDWLAAKAKDAGLKVDNIKPAPRPTISSGFRAIGYQLEASGSLESLVKMMYEFYRSPQLHQITRLRLQRPVGGSELQVSLEAEALILPGAVATDSLPQGESKRLKLASVEDYQKSLGERDLASVYTPPRPPREAPTAPPAPPKFDDAEQAYFTSTVGNGDGLQAWIHVRTTGETLKLNVGEPVKVGALEGQIVSVERWSLVFQTGDQKFLVPIGHSLRKGKPLDAMSKAPADIQAVQAEEAPKS